MERCSQTYSSLNIFKSHPIRFDDEKENFQAAATSGEYSKEEAAQVEDRLKALGYIE